MANEPFTFSQGDDPPDFEATAEDYSGPKGTLAPVDLTGATGVFLLAHLGDSGNMPHAVLEGAVVVDSDQVNNKGNFSYSWNPADKAVRVAGSYGAKVIFTFGNGHERAFPTVGLYPVLITNTILE